MSAVNRDNNQANGSSDATALLGFVHQVGQVMNVKARKVLFEEGEHCTGAYFIEEGELELTLSSADRKMTLGVAYLGQMLALAAVIRECEHKFTATAISNSRVLFLPAEKVRNYLRQHPESCLQTVQMMGSEILDLSTNMIRPLRLQPRYPKSH